MKDLSRVKTEKGALKMAMVSIKDCAAELGVSYSTIRNMCIEGKIPHILVGKSCRRIDVAEAKKALAVEAEAKKQPKVKPVKRYPPLKRTGKLDFLAALDAIGR